MEITVHAKRAEPSCNPCIYQKFLRFPLTREHNASILPKCLDGPFGSSSQSQCKASEKPTIKLSFSESQPNFILQSKINVLKYFNTPYTIIRLFAFAPLKWHIFAILQAVKVHIWGGSGRNGCLLISFSKLFCKDFRRLEKKLSLW